MEHEELFSKKKNILDKIGNLNDFRPGTLSSCFRKCGKRWSDIPEAGKKVKEAKTCMDYLRACIKFS